MRKPLYVAATILVLLGITAGTHPLNAQSKSDETAINALYSRFTDAFVKKDVNAIMAIYAPNVFVFDVVPPREYPTWDAYKKDWEGVFAAYPGPVTAAISEMNITVVGSVAYTHYIEGGSFTAADGTKTPVVVRNTDVLRKINGKWLIVQEHVSVPVDLSTGKADMMSTP
jgi:ketosteroid isomerase-like protein